MKCISIETAMGSLIFELDGDGPPIWRHVGARVAIEGLPGWRALARATGFTMDDPVPFSTAPLAGLGWFGPAAVEVSRAGRPLAGNFIARRCEVSDDALRVELEDPLSGVALTQCWRSEGEVFHCSASLTNTADTPLDVALLAAALIPLPSLATLISWRGRHAAELGEYREPMPSQQWRRLSREGLPGHGGPPGVYCLAQGATRNAGLVVAAQLAWSGDSVIEIERDMLGGHTLRAAVRLDPGECILAPQQTLDTPDLLLAISTRGTNGAMQSFHAALRKTMVWPGGAMRPRPVHLNSWEACYFDHDEARMAELADAAAALGAERFVLDDGWFQGRSDDTRALGDWTPDRRKYPSGLRSLAERVEAAGMEFGLWVEPEMISPDSDLHRTRPDWVLAHPGLARPTSRHQLVLDMARADVRDHLFDRLDTLLAEAPVRYLKWDHNRPLAPHGGAAQVEGCQALLERLRLAHPTLEIESCAAGGGRSDAGMLRYVHRFWPSDNLDAVSRIAIQRAFLAFLPPETMGTHVGAAPAHATGRSQSLDFRAAVAFGGHFGIELDPGTLTDAERAGLAGWIAFYKEWRDLLHGRRTWVGEAGDDLVWQAQGEVDRFLVTVLRVAHPADRPGQALCLPFVAQDSCYRIFLKRTAGRVDASPPAFAAMQLSGVEMTGSWLANAGLPLPSIGAESAAIFLAERVA